MGINEAAADCVGADICVAHKICIKITVYTEEKDVKV